MTAVSGMALATGQPGLPAASAMPLAKTGNVTAYNPHSSVGVSNGN